MCNLGVTSHSGEWLIFLFYTLHNLIDCLACSCFWFSVSALPSKKKKKKSVFTWKNLINLVSVPADQHCELNCRAKGFRFYVRQSDRVIDGTPCGQNSTATCVAGKCSVGLKIIFYYYFNNKPSDWCTGDENSIVWFISWCWLCLIQNYCISVRCCVLCEQQRAAQHKYKLRLSANWEWNKGQEEESFTLLLGQSRECGNWM